MSEFAKKFTKEALREGLSNLVWAYWPMWGAPAMSAILFYLKHYPIEIIFSVSISTFAITAFGLNNFSQWFGARTAEGKANFGLPIVGIHRDESVDPPKLLGLKLGMGVVSSAHFPMEIRIDELVTQISTRVPKEKFFQRSVAVNRAGGANFSNAVIDLSDLDLKNATIYGHIETKVSYGRPGKLKYNLERTTYLAFKFDKNGSFINAEPSLTELEKA
jgi:hypothetical protein